jgi:hypothetical protein
VAAILVNQLVVPSGVEYKKNKTALTFQRGPKRAVLKGRALELSNPLKSFNARLKIYSSRAIKRCHLGSIKAVVPKVKDVVDLQKLLNKYFR